MLPHAAGASDCGANDQEKRLPTARAASSRPAILCGLLYLGAFLLLASVLRGHFGFPLDDSWIHQVVARNLAEFHVLGFNAGKLSSGSTSPLWTLILTVGWVVLPKVSPVLFCLFISCLILFAIGFVLKRLTEDDGLPAGASWCLALGPVASGNFLWFGLIGMEHLLFLLLSLMLIRTWFAPVSRCGVGYPILLAVLCLLLVLTRPEGIFLVLLLLLVRGGAGRTMRDWLKAFGGAACGMVILAVINWLTSGRLTPQTMQGRQFLAGGAHIGVSQRVYFFGQSFARVLKTWSFGASESILHGRGLVVGLLLFVLLAAIVISGVRGLRRLGANRFLFLCVWGGVIELLYFAMLPNTGHGGRYISLALTVFLSLFFFGCSRVLGAAGLSERGVWIGVCMLGVVTAAISIPAWRRAAAAGIDQINLEHGGMAVWLEQNLPRGSFDAPQVAMFDIGRIGYQFHGNVVDLGGLVDRDYMPYLLHQRTAAYLYGHNVEYVVLPTDAALGDAYFTSTLALDPAHWAVLRPLHSVCADAAMVRLTFASTSAAFQCQTVYSIDYIAPAIR
jgi:hypothetical protein